TARAIVILACTRSEFVWVPRGRRGINKEGEDQVTTTDRLEIIWPFRRQFTIILHPILTSWTSTSEEIKSSLEITIILPLNNTDYYSAIAGLENMSRQAESLATDVKSSVFE
ncbi:GSCOCG00004246001-RA-CDS, partial [Cotesia congregata]